MWKQEFVDAKERFAEAFMLPKDLVMNATLFHMICLLYTSPSPRDTR